MTALRHSHTLRGLSLLIAACFVTRPVPAQYSGSAASPETSIYVFRADQSAVVQTGGMACVYWTYSIAGQFQLTVDPNAGTAFFAHVAAKATDDSPLQRTLDPNQVFNLAALVGTVIDKTTIQFTGQAVDASAVQLTVALRGDSAQLIGQTMPPPRSADFFLFNLDAVAQRKYGGGAGEPNDPYRIATAAHLIALGETATDYGKHFVLTADVDLDPNRPGGKVFDKAVIAPDTDPLNEDFQGTPFTGTFDGRGHRISRLTIKGGGYLGLFGLLGRRGWLPLAVVENLGVSDVNLVGAGRNVGGLAGRTAGVVTRCHSTGAVSGESDVGGLAGRNLGTMIRCYSTSAVSNTDSYVGGLLGSNGGAVAQCYSAGNLSGGFHVGGLVGHNDGSVTQCYSTGAVGGLRSVGGLIGSNSDLYQGQGIVTLCFWDMQTSGQATSAGGTGKAKAEMQTAATFLAAGWDFVGETVNGTEDIWWILEGKDYPRLSWENVGQ